MSTNSTLSVLTPKHHVCFIFSEAIIWHGMLVNRVGMENFVYYVELDEEVALTGKTLYKGQVKLTTTRVMISKEQFTQLLTVYLPIFER